MQVCRPVYPFPLLSFTQESVRRGSSSGETTTNKWYEHWAASDSNRWTGRTPVPHAAVLEKNTQLASLQVLGKARAVEVWVDASVEPLNASARRRTLGSQPAEGC